jgi:hypothetical protein
MRLALPKVRFRGSWIEFSWAHDAAFGNCWISARGSVVVAQMTPT